MTQLEDRTTTTTTTWQVRAGQAPTRVRLWVVRRVHLRHLQWATTGRPKHVAPRHGLTFPLLQALGLHDWTRAVNYSHAVSSEQCRRTCSSRWTLPASRSMYIMAVVNTLEFDPMRNTVSPSPCNKSRGAQGRLRASWHATNKKAGGLSRGYVCHCQSFQTYKAAMTQTAAAGCHCSTTHL